MEKIDKQLSDKSVYPSDDVLSEVLGKSYPAYKKLLSIFDKRELKYEWRHYNDVKVWLFKVQSKKKKTIVWMSACKGYMRATVYIPEKYSEGVFNLDIPEEAKEYLKEKKCSAKSLPCMFDIKNTKILSTFEKVVDYKLSLK